MIPKYGLDVDNCEIGRFLKAGNNNVIEQIQLSQPRRAQGIFYEEMFPATPSAYAISAQDWTAGKSAAPIKISLHPQKRKTVWELEQNFK